MATKTTSGMKPVDALTGKVTGKRYNVVLDDIHIGDIWDPRVLPVLQDDGLGKTTIDEGVTKFTFHTSDKATIAFVADAGKLKIEAFFIFSDEKEQA